MKESGACFGDHLHYHRTSTYHTHVSGRAYYKNFTFGMLYLMKSGIQLHGVHILPTVMALQNLLPPESQLQRRFNFKCKNITDVENKINLLLHWIFTGVTCDDLFIFASLQCWIVVPDVSSVSSILCACICPWQCMLCILRSSRFIIPYSSHWIWCCAAKTRAVLHAVRMFLWEMDCYWTARGSTRRRRHVCQVTILQRNR